MNYYEIMREMKQNERDATVLVYRFIMRNTVAPSNNPFEFPQGGAGHIIIRFRDGLSSEDEVRYNLLSYIRKLDADRLAQIKLEIFREIETHQKTIGRYDPALYGLCFFILEEFFEYCFQNMTEEELENF